MPFEPGSKWKGKPNPNMDLWKTPSTSAVTQVGKMRRDITKFSRDWIAKYDPNLLELFDWYKSYSKKEIDYILELKNLIFILKDAALPALIDKISKGETPTKQEMDVLRLLKETIVDSHKLKYGDRKVIENIVTVADIRKQMRSDKKIINVKAIKDKPVSEEK